MDDSDVAAAHAVVRSLQDAFNAHDPDALAAHYTDDAAWTSARGVRMSGRAEVAAFGRSVMPHLADQYAAYEVVRVVEIRPDVLAVSVHQTPTTPDGTPVDGHRGSALYVLARDGDGWLIAAGQNTVIA